MTAQDAPTVALTVAALALPLIVADALRQARKPRPRFRAGR